RVRSLVGALTAALGRYDARRARDRTGEPCRNIAGHVRMPGRPRRGPPPPTPRHRAHPAAPCPDPGASPAARYARAQPECGDPPRLELENDRKTVATAAAIVVRDRHHRRHLGLPALIHRVARQLGNGAIVVHALDDVKEVETIAENLPAGYTDAAHPSEDLRPDGGVGGVIALLGADLEPRMQSDRHHAVRPRIWNALLGSQRGAKPSLAGCDMRRGRDTSQLRVAARDRFEDLGMFHARFFERLLTHAT